MPPRNLRIGENLGQNLNLAAALTVPTDSQGDVSEAGLFFQSKADARGDNLFDGTNAGFWGNLQSTGQVEVARLDTQRVVAYSGYPLSFNTTVSHNLQVAVQGNQLQIELDSDLLAMSIAGLVSTVVTLPTTSGSNGRRRGCALRRRPNPNEISGQRADNLVISTYSSLTGLPVQDNFQDRFGANSTFAAAANVGVGPGVHLANLSIRTPTEQDW